MESDSVYMNIEPKRSAVDKTNSQAPTTGADDDYESPDIIKSNDLPGIPKRSLALNVSVFSSVLCVLLVAGILGLWFYHYEENNKLEKELNEYKTSYENLTQEIDNVQKELNLTKEGWKMFGGRYFYFSTYRKIWTDSRSVCIARGADLVSIKSQEEQDFLLGKNDLTMWVGLSDLDVKGTWKWLDGTLLSGTTPTNGVNATLKATGCVTIHRNASNKGKYQAWPCSYVAFFCCVKV